jgi:hypothetical protein
MRALPEEQTANVVDLPYSGDMLHSAEKPIPTLSRRSNPRRDQEALCVRSIRGSTLLAANVLKRRQDGTQQVQASRPLPAMGAEFAPGLPSIQSNSPCVIVLCQHRDVLLRGDMQRMVWEWLRRFRQPRWTTI